MERLPRKEMIYDMLLKEPNDLFLNYALALEHVATENFIDAEEQFLKTLSISSAYLPCYYQLGQLYEKLADPTKAIGFYKQGIELANKQGNKKAMGELNEALWLLED
jgi:tetratricopeptide (TPR) repeat protein